MLSVIDSLGSYSTNSPGIGGLIWFHYKLYEEKGYAEYISKSLRGASTKESRYIVKIKPGFPTWDMWSSIYFTARFLDLRSMGIWYLVLPEIIKEPIPFTTHYVGKKTVSTRAGKFSVLDGISNVFTK